MKDIFSKLILSILKSHMNFIMIYHFEKVEKLLTNLNDKAEYVIHIRNVNKALNH